LTAYVDGMDRVCFTHVIFYEPPSLWNVDGLKVWAFFWALVAKRS